MINLLFQSKENRDARFKEMKAAGQRVRKSSITNQLLHPQYVEDFTGPEKLDTGFGNTVYKTHFGVIYKIVEA
jgi:hypothetical protein